MNSLKHISFWNANILLNLNIKIFRPIFYGWSGSLLNLCLIKNPSFEIKVFAVVFEQDSDVANTIGSFN